MHENHILPKPIRENGLYAQICSIKTKHGQVNSKCKVANHLNDKSKSVHPSITTSLSQYTITTQHNLETAIGFYDRSMALSHIKGLRLRSLTQQILMRM